MYQLEEPPKSCCVTEIVTTAPRHPESCTANRMVTNVVRKRHQRGFWNWVRSNEYELWVILLLIEVGIFVCVTIWKLTP